MSRKSWFSSICQCFKWDTKWQFSLHQQHCVKVISKVWNASLLREKKSVERPQCRSQRPTLLLPVTNGVDINDDEIKKGANPLGRRKNIEKGWKKFIFKTYVEFFFRNEWVERFFGQKKLKENWMKNNYLNF